MDTTEEDGQRVRAFRHDDEVYVIGHQAVGEDADAGVGLMACDQTQVGIPVGGGEKDRLVVRPALGYVVG